MTAITTRIAAMRRLYSNDVTSSSYASSAPTATAPATNGTGFFKMGDIQGDVGIVSGSNILKLVFFGRRTADNQTFSALINGWHRVGDTGGLWFPVPMLEVTLTQGSAVGVAGELVDANHYFVDTIVVANGYVTTASYEPITPVGNLIGMVKLDMAGCAFAEVQLKTGTNVACNVLASPF